MDVKGALLFVLGQHLLKEDLASAKAALRDWAGSDPMGSLLDVVMLGSALFFEAEKEHNPKVNSMSDAMVFVSTCLSVGYSDIFAKTEQGKLIATALQMFGPALTAQALEAPHIASNRIEEDSLAVQNDILTKLDAILVELQRQRR
jgi:voltage-gated potassium channel